MSILRCYELTRPLLIVEQLLATCFLSLHFVDMVAWPSDLQIHLTISKRSKGFNYIPKSSLVIAGRGWEPKSSVVFSLRIAYIETPIY